jgi:hypothetical protein
MVPEDAEHCREIRGENSFLGGAICSRCRSGGRGFARVLDDNRAAGDWGFLHIPAKRFNPGFESTREDDPLPLLSVSIDNMHVDEVQIDGGGNEAVVAGNMENPGKRLIVLEGGEVEAL